MLPGGQREAILAGIAVLNEIVATDVYARLPASRRIADAHGLQSLRGSFQTIDFFEPEVRTIMVLPGFGGEFAARSGVVLVHREREVNRVLGAGFALTAMLHKTDGWIFEIGRDLVKRRDVHRRVQFHSLRQGRGQRFRIAHGELGLGDRTWLPSFALNGARAHESFPCLGCTSLTKLRQSSSSRSRLSGMSRISCAAMRSEPFIDFVCDVHNAAVHRIRCRHASLDAISMRRCTVRCLFPHTHGYEWAWRFDWNCRAIVATVLSSPAPFATLIRLPSVRGVM